MAGKVYTVELDEKKLASSVSSKQTKLTVKPAQKEVETFGIVEINNNSAKNKVKNTKDVGFEKNLVGTKKSVKSAVSKVDDYFDFSFRPETKTCKTETKAEDKVCAKKEIAPKVATTLKVEEKTLSERQIKDEAKACERFVFDDAAKKIVSVARAGSLFG